MSTQPFTVEHFSEWASDLVLDTGEAWILEPFQLAFLADVFGAKAEVWLLLPEGNAKTTTIAGLALYFAEHKPHASIPVAAASREQAQIVYQQAERFVLASPRLHELVHSEVQVAKGKRKVEVPRFTCLEGYRRINHADGARIQVHAADDRTGDGVIPDLALVDELHRHRDLSLYRTWAGKLLKRQGQIVAISTAGVPGSDFEDTRERMRVEATDVARDGSFGRYATESSVLHEYALLDGADPDDITAVKAANPLAAITIESLAEKHARQTSTPGHWLRFVCNRPARPEEAAISEAEWRAAEVGGEIPKGEPVDVGADFGFKWDTTAVVPLWVRDPGYRLLGPASIIVPPRDGSSIHPDSIKTAFLSIHARNPIRVVVLDPSDALDIAAWIRDELGAELVEFKQTNTAHVAAYQKWMEGLRNGWLKHTGDPGLTRHVFNAVTRILPYGDARFDRPSMSRRSAVLQEQRVVDALTAASMVVSVVEGGEEKKRRPSRYNSVEHGGQGAGLVTA